MTKFNIRVFFGLACVLLLLLSAFLYLRTDRKPPVIHFGDADIVYKEGEDPNDLLTKLRAEDNRDGDVTDKVFIVSITPNNDQTKAVVLYGVSDKAHNATTAARTVTYQATGQEASSPDSANDDSKAKTENPSDEKSKGDGETGKDSEKNSDKDSDKNSDTGSDANAANSDQDTNASANADQPVAGSVQSEGSNPAAPVVTLSSSQVEIKAGSRFNPVGVVTSITDDKDDQNALFRRVNVSGDYNTKQPGSYPIQITVTDSDGNTSAPVSFNLVVQ